MSLLEDLDHALGQAILHGYPQGKAEEARGVLFEIDRRVLTAIIALEKMPPPAPDIAKQLKAIIPPTEPQP